MTQLLLIGVNITTQNIQQAQSMDTRAGEATQASGFAHIRTNFLSEQFS